MERAAVVCTFEEKASRTREDNFGVECSDDEISGELGAPRRCGDGRGRGTEGPSDKIK